MSIYKRAVEALGHSQAPPPPQSPSPSPGGAGSSFPPSPPPTREEQGFESPMTRRAGSPLDERPPMGQHDHAWQPGNAKNSLNGGTTPIDCRPKPAATQATACYTHCLQQSASGIAATLTFSRQSGLQTTLAAWQRARQSGSQRTLAACNDRSCPTAHVQRHRSCKPLHRNVRPL